MAILDQLNHLRLSIVGIYPEIFLACFFLGLLVIDVLPRRSQQREATSTLFDVFYLGGIVVTIGLLFNQWYGERGFLFNGMLFVGSKAIFYKILVAISWLLAVLHIRKLKYKFNAEIYSLMAAAVLGANILCMATNLLSIYLAIEIISLSSYLLVGISPNSKAAEGGIKYLLFGTISSAVMLYGISFIYGLTGTLDITDENMRLLLLENSPYVMYVTSFLTLGGLLFKLSLVPFHIWTPDTYEAAPTPIVSFLSVVPKIAVLLVLMRLVYALPDEVRPLLGGIAVISMFIGNVAALAQTNARRLLAYSTISQAGYLIVGVVAFSATGFEAATFYVAAYAFLNMATFFLIDSLAPQSDTQLAYFSGKGPQYLVIGVALTIALVGLAGLPPTVGFTSKWLVFSGLWESYQLEEAQWMLYLLIGGILNTTISLVYYIKIPYLMFFKTSTEETNPQLNQMSYSFVAGLIAILIITLFLQPQLITDLIERL